MGDGYGSEYHLHRYLTTHRAQLAEGVGSAVGIEPSKVKWRTASAKARRWRAYLTGDGVAVYCPKCALREFGPHFASRFARP
jgi:hypothetical protein